MHVLKYIFPRQFGLHNVFGSVVNSSETAQRFKDYTYREQEISQAMHEESSRGDRTTGPPKRLRGDVLGLITKLRRKHRKCPYVELLNHYCSAETTGRPDTTVVASGRSSVSFATPTANVSGFARAVTARVIPNELWGSGEGGNENKRSIMRNIDRFICSRRYESLSLHAVLQGIKVNISS